MATLGDQPYTVLKISHQVLRSKKFLTLYEVHVHTRRLQEKYQSELGLAYGMCVATAWIESMA